MSDEQVESAATETTETETQATATSAETENTDQGGRGPIPYDRFKEVNDKYKTSREEAEALAAERDALQRRVDEMATAPKPKSEVDTGAGNGELSTPPAGLSERETVAWYVRNDAEALLREKLGMSLDDAAVLLKSVPQAATYANEQTWNSLCQSHGMDPGDKRVRRLAAGFLQEAGDSADPAKIVAEVAELVGAKKPTASTQNSPSPRNVETDGMGSQFTVDDWVPSTREEAAKAAADGRRAADLSTTEIFRRKKLQQRAKGS